MPSKNPSRDPDQQPWLNQSSKPINWVDCLNGRTPAGVLDLLQESAEIHPQRVGAVKVLLEPGDATRYELLLILQLFNYNETQQPVLTCLQLGSGFYDVRGGFSFPFDGRWIMPYDGQEQTGHRIILPYTSLIMRFYCNLLVEVLHATA